nr:PTB-containing, cubilin and LRP1-interacting protein isoform X2 [Equus caballus]
MLRARRSGRRRRRRGRRRERSPPPPPPCARGPGRSCAVLWQLRQDSRRAAVPTSCRQQSAAPPPPARRPLCPPGGRRPIQDAPPADTDPRCKAGPQPLAPWRDRPSLASVCSAKPRGWKMWQPATERLQERFEDTEETQERSHVQTEAESGVRLSQAKGCKDCWPPAEARRVKEGFFPRASAGSTALPTS